MASNIMEEIPISHIIFYPYKMSPSVPTLNKPKDSGESEGMGNQGRRNGRQRILRPSVTFIPQLAHHFCGGLRTVFKNSRKQNRSYTTSQVSSRVHLLVKGRNHSDYCPGFRTTVDRFQIMKKVLCIRSLPTAPLHNSQNMFDLPHPDPENNKCLRRQGRAFRERAQGASVQVCTATIELVDPHLRPILLLLTLQNQEFQSSTPQHSQAWSCSALEIVERSCNQLSRESSP